MEKGRDDVRYGIIKTVHMYSAWEIIIHVRAC